MTAGIPLLRFSNAARSTTQALTAVGVLAVAVSVLAPVALLDADRASAQTMDFAPDASADAPSSKTFTFGLSVVEPPDGLSATRRETPDEGSRGWFFRSWRSPSAADTARDSYEQAVTALEAGKTAEAQRLFEQLIADAPNSTHASEARRHLGQLYRRQAAVTETESLPSASAPAGQRASTIPWTTGSTKAEARPASLNVTPVPRSVLLEGRVSRLLDDSFLGEAGDRVFFSSGSADLGNRALGVIRAQARFLMQHPGLAAVVEGHADDGQLPDDETLRLSQARALAVRELLVAEGVDPERLTAYGRGRDERVADCPEPECLAQNRRAITILLDGAHRLSQRPRRQAPPANAEARERATQ